MKKTKKKSLAIIIIIVLIANDAEDQEPLGLCRNRGILLSVVAAAFTCGCRFKLSLEKIIKNLKKSLWKVKHKEGFFLWAYFSF